MPKPKGRSIPLSLPRRFVCDLVHFAKKVPTVPVERRMQLGAVVDARRLAMPRPSWCAIFAKAYGLVCMLHPELRRAYIPFPLPRLYEHPVPEASVAIERTFGDENAVFLAQIRSPHQRSLRDMDLKLRRLKELPLERFCAYRRILRTSSLPRPIRRFLWWCGLNVSGQIRARRMGTFGISVYGGMGATSLHPLSPLTTLLNTGVFADDGSVDVRLVYDHRTLDGATVARALRDLEQVLNGEILNELRYMRMVEAA